MADAPFTATGSLLEALRFAADQHEGAWCAPGYPLVNHLLDTVSLLWQAGAVRDPKVLVAAALHGAPVAAVEAVAGAEVAGYVAAVQDPASLAVPRLQRLVPAATRRRLEAGRQIFLAALAAKVRRGLPAEQLAAAYAAAGAFRGTCPPLESLLTFPSDSPSP